MPSAMTDQAGRSTRSWSTKSVVPSRAFDYWVSTVCDHLLEFEIDSPARDTFEAQLLQSQLAFCSLSIAEAPVQRVERTSAIIGKSLFDDYRLLYVRWGGGDLRQFGRQIEFVAGDCVLVDSTEPYGLHFTVPTSCSTLAMPRGWLHSWMRSPQIPSAQRLDGRTSWGGALAAAMRGITEHASGELALPAAVVADQLAALLVMASSGVAAPRSWDRSRLDRMNDTLIERCHEIDLDPASVAAEHDISKRYLHRIYARAGTTFGEALMTIRLERACRMLRDPGFRDLPVGEIAAQCGFSEPSHFARRYRARFGASPTEARRSRSGD